MAGADTAEGEKSIAGKEPPALHSTTQPDDLRELHEQDKYLHGRALVLMTLSLKVGVITVALDNRIISMWVSYQSIAVVGSHGLLTKDDPSASVLGLICAAAPNSPVFITGRAVAGLGAAGLFCGAMIIMSQIVGMRKRPLLLGIVTSMCGVASGLGPSLGGIFTHSARLTWRFCFWINLPLGGLTGFIVCFYYASSLGGAPYKNCPLRQKLTSLGLKSALILTGTLVCLILALQWGGSVYPWSDCRVWGCFLGFGLLLALFGYMQHRQKDDALIPLRVLSQRSVLLGCTFSCLLQGAMMTQTYYLPFCFQAIRGTNAQTSGFSILPYGVTVSIATLLSGTLVTLSGFYVPLTSP
ncbi:hypothetical protein Asppvi_011409 [Aspergillus pseudoviridinutans]|uniref:Major facilitator superfamily (MFS) profile domain-containing protein n=1 Tax=Aspergillus pseudoviridinutans TaxID=1517512 RepID=A0A9P3BJT4_9EURO|nr:uncharacterized protein Asppvi_011409 [Aspergillus pseudoviridinutans]GIJ92427.1 hypothetical protein Asppvi_011409 [Aspergillus pseudoviridinutans]